MMSFTHRESEMRVYRVSVGNKLDGMASIWQHNSLIKDVLISFDSDGENILRSILTYLQIAGTYIYNGEPKLNTIFGGFRVTGKPWVLTYLPGATLQNDVIAYFQFQILRSYSNRVSPLLQIPMERLWKLMGKPSKPKAQNWKQHFLKNSLRL